MKTRLAALTQCIVHMIVTHLTIIFMVLDYAVDQVIVRGLMNTKRVVA